ncbi:Uncharacterized protein GBIM_14331, partial [Gryllus bimaculatus]
NIWVERKLTLDIQFVSLPTDASNHAGDTLVQRPPTRALQSRLRARALAAIGAHRPHAVVSAAGAAVQVRRRDPKTPASRATERTKREVDVRGAAERVRAGVGAMVARATGVGAGAAARAAPEALLARHDAELRLLDTVRRCVAAKLKCDRDYALALAAVAAQGQKGDRQEELQGSLVAQAWRSLMAELEGAGRLLRAGADALEARALERLHSLQAEKRRTRKQLQEEHGRLASRLAHHLTTRLKNF